ncbi:DUF6286 domain-containing protein [Cellulomonas iranensis]|uniref:DUF6286 domain-containing protein n=1 Tax=Cellulomonas iranensis TaxID=76862 RepID=UPI001CF5B581|nr:DUF6286 domain-containing protein [Cellulomonas iranensis]UCN14518.1 DUF6286 domain-containing protein [Cellulomonas iranensis]
MTTGTPVPRTGAHVAPAEAPAPSVAAAPTGRPDDATPRRPVPYAPPRPAGTLAWLGPLLAVVVLAVAVVLVHDGLVALGALPGTSWVADAGTGLGTLRPTWPVALVGVVVALAGLRLVVVALTPRRRPGLPLSAGAGQHVRGQDVARLASAAAARVDGVLDVSSTWGRRAVTVTATTDGDPTLEARVAVAVTQRLTALTDPPRVVVRTRRARTEDAETRGGAR